MCLCEGCMCVCEGEGGCLADPFYVIVMATVVCTCVYVYWREGKENGGRERERTIYNFSLVSFFSRCMGQIQRLVRTAPADQSETSTADHQQNGDQSTEDILTNGDHSTAHQQENGDHSTTDHQ